MNGLFPRVSGWIVAAAVLAVLGCGPGEQSTASVSSDQEALQSSSGPKVTPQNSGTTAGLIGISALNARVAWASGRSGTFAVTTDGGKTWHAGVVPGAEGLQFRDVEAVSAKIAYLLSVPTNPPEVIGSRIYKTVDGGMTWRLQFQASPDEFHDCFAFWDPWTGFDLADSLGGRFPAVRTFDGQTWHDYGDRLPTPLPGEAGFAASGTCAATQGHRRGWLTTGGAGVTRVFYTTDRGQTWGATTAPITAGVDQAGGGFSIAFRDARHGILAGGDLAVTDVVDNFARSSDGGRTWTLGARAPIPGAIFGAAYAGHGRGEGLDDDEHDRGGSIRVVATSPAATAWSPDEGNTWNLIPGLSGLWSVDFGSQQTGWLVGTNGQIVRIDF
jgi:BNR/Asp-box repeat